MIAAAPPGSDADGMLRRRKNHSTAAGLHVPDDSDQSLLPEQTAEIIDDDRCAVVDETDTLSCLASLLNDCEGDFLSWTNEWTRRVRKLIEIEHLHILY
jgi:hypothetical protein